MAKKLSILDKTFQLALLLHRRTAEFNRKYKFTIGDRIDVVGTSKGKGYAGAI